MFMIKVGLWLYRPLEQCGTHLCTMRVENSCVYILTPKNCGQDRHKGAAHCARGQFGMIYSCQVPARVRGLHRFGTDGGSACAAYDIIR